jgi:hypothetical protein
MQSLGIKLESVVATFIEVIAKSITADFAYVKTVEADSVTTKTLKVGDTSNLGAVGITTYDRATGAPTCIYIDNGVMKSETGECGVVSTETVNLPNTPAPEPTPEITPEVIPDQTPEAVVENSSENTNPEASTEPVSETPASEPTPIE